SRDEWWQAVLADVRTLRGMREAARRGHDYVVNMPREEDLGGVTGYAGATEAVRLQGAALGSQYGGLLGSTLGRLAGVLDPSWWMGRNFWIGLLLAADFGPVARLLQRSGVAVQNAMIAVAQSPALLFASVAVEGFEEGFPIGCDEAYCSGLYFPPAAVTTIRDTMTSRPRDWIAL